MRLFTTLDGVCVYMSWDMFFFFYNLGFRMTEHKYLLINFVYIIQWNVERLSNQIIRFDSIVHTHHMLLTIE